MVDAAISLDALLVPPGNRLEALQGDRQGEHSIRINDQWHGCFVWRDGNAYEVEICDYHEGGRHEQQQDDGADPSGKDPARGVPGAAGDQPEPLGPRRRHPRSAH
ncbi:MAG TPA: type II toxin-antitoxin system RelE/ParE family toxin [Pantanalinema sp.]